MAGCGCDDVVFDGLSRGYRRVLWLVIAINAVMFVVELSAGLASGSMALRADALDFFGDSVTYFITLMVIGQPLIWRSRAALLKGLSLAAMGIWILSSTVYRVFILEVPNEFVMGSVGFLALLANVASVLLLMRYRDGDANIRSVWLCSRNDAIGNIAVVGAALAVGATASAWPDLMVAAIMASLFLYSSSQIIRHALSEMRIKA
jgi:Co/Zn/Cd efflux system component